MRRQQDPQVTMLPFVDLEARVRPDHPLRTIKVLADRALAVLSPEFDRMYADVGRPSLTPERLLKASHLISLYPVRSERAFCESWMVGVRIAEVVGRACVYCAVMALVVLGYLGWA